MRLPLTEIVERANEEEKMVNETAFEKIVDLQEKEQMRRRKRSMILLLKEIVDLQE